MLKVTGLTIVKRFFKQSFVTWQILGLALHPDRPVECGLYFTLTLNYLKTILCDFADFTQTGVGVGCYRGWGMELDTHSLDWGTGHSSAS